MDEGLVSMLYDVLGMAVIEGDRLHVLGAPAGPAGSSRLVLPDGEVWEVDHLHPLIPVGMEVDVHLADRSPLLVAAFGGDGALYLADEAVEWSPDASTLVDPIDSRPSRREYERGSLAHRPDDPALVAGRVVVLSDLSADPRSHPLARIAATAELMSITYGVSGGELLLPVLPRLAQTAADLALMIDPDELDALDADLAGRLSHALSAIGSSARRVGSPLAALSGALRFRAGQSDPRSDRRSGRPSDLGVLSLSVSPPPDEPGLLAAADPADGPSPHDEDLAAAPAPLSLFEHVDLHGPDQSSDDSTYGGTNFLELRRVTPARLQVRTTRSEGERWVRAYRRSGLVPLAQAPLHRQDLAEAADLVIPPEVADGDLLVDIVSADDLEGPLLLGRNGGGVHGGGSSRSRGNTQSAAGSQRPVNVIHAAVDAGRVAARITRLHGATEARAHWATVADLWRSVGDWQRGEIAQSLAEGNPGPRILPYLADEVTEAFSASE